MPRETASCAARPEHPREKPGRGPHAPPEPAPISVPHEKRPRKCLWVHVRKTVQDPRATRPPAAAPLLQKAVRLKDLDGARGDLMSRHPP